MKKAILKDESSFRSRPDNRPEHPEIFPPIEGRPGRTNTARPFITAESSNPNPPTSSGGGSATLNCTCNVVVAYERYSQGPDHDPEYYYRKCELHQKYSNAFWLISTLEELDDVTRYAPLTAEGQAFRRELLAMKGGA